MPGEPTEGTIQPEDKPKVDESKYADMEVAAAAGGAEADARRLEMAKWAEAQGVLADTRAAQQREFEQHLLRNGKSAETLKSRVDRYTAATHDNGDAIGHGEFAGATLKATESGIQETRVDDGVSGEYRSPTHVRGEQEKSDQESPEGPQAA